MKYLLDRFTVPGCTADDWNRIFGAPKGARSPEQSDSTTPGRKIGEKGKRHGRS